MNKHHRCPHCDRVMLKVIFQGHSLGYRPYLICTNATQLRCLRCGVILESVTGGMARKSRDWYIGKHNLYTTTFTNIDLLDITEDRVAGTDYLFPGELA